MRTRSAGWSCPNRSRPKHPSHSGSANVGEPYSGRRQRPDAARVSTLFRDPSVQPDDGCVRRTRAGHADPVRRERRRERRAGALRAGHRCLCTRRSSVVKVRSVGTDTQRRLAHVRSGIRAPLRGCSQQAPAGVRRCLMPAAWRRCSPPTSGQSFRCWRQCRCLRCSVP